jgi:hypothetical protein
LYLLTTVFRSPSTRSSIEEEAMATNLLENRDQEKRKAPENARNRFLITSTYHLTH